MRKNARGSVLSKSGSSHTNGVTFLRRCAALAPQLAEQQMFPFSSVVLICSQPYAGKRSVASGKPRALNSHVSRFTPKSTDATDPRDCSNTAVY